MKITNHLQECKDGKSNDPTCGYSHFPNGTNIPYSQGFCCRCSFGDVFNNNQIHRGNLECNPFGYKMASAHCLRFGEYWWDLFNIGLGQLHYEINIHIKGENYEEIVSVSPSSPATVNNNSALAAKIIGDFSPWTQYPTFANYFLSIPSSPLSSSRVQAGPMNWMIVDKHLVDISGTSCNKIGVGYDAFYSQSTRCEVDSGSCLMNQLDDYYNADEERRNQDLSPNYLLSRYGEYVDIKNLTTYNFGLRIDQIQNTLLTLYLKADGIRYIQYVSKGRILSAEIKTFESLSREGNLDVSIGNTGSVISEYYVTVTSCTEGILNIPAQQFSCSPYQTCKRLFKIYSQTVFGQYNQCTVKLLDSVYSLLDEVIVYFNTTDKIDHSNQNGTSENPPGGKVVTDQKSMGCKDYCPMILDLPCFIVKGCWGNALLVLFLVALIIFVIVALVKTKCCMKPICCCCCKRKKKKRKVKKNVISEETAVEKPKRVNASLKREDPVLWTSSEEKPAFATLPPAVKVSKSDMESSDYDFIPEPKDSDLNFDDVVFDIDDDSA